jgi:hypothetical protein
MDAKLGGLQNMLRAIVGQDGPGKSREYGETPLLRQERNMNKNSAMTRSTHAIGTGQGALSDTMPSRQRRILWIDAVGGFLCCDQEEIVVGQAAGSNEADLAIVGDLSRQAAAIRRNGGDYLLQPLQAMTINDRPVDRAQLLQDGQVLQMGRRVKVKFSKPNPLSATARLDLVSLNRWKPHVDGVLLLADSCVIGPNPGSHVLCPTWKQELLLFRLGDGWCFRTLSEVEVNGEKTRGQIPLVTGTRLRGDDFSLSVE